MRPNLSCPFSLSFLFFVLRWSCCTSFNNVVHSFEQLAAMCPKLKHLNRLVFEVLVDDLRVEGFWVETFGEEVVSLEKVES